MGYGQKKKVLRARRTRGPKMAKNPNFRNSIRHAQNVRLVLISIAQYPIIPKRPFLAKISRGYIFGEFWGPGPMGPMGPIGPYWPLGALAAIPFGGAYWYVLQPLLLRPRSPLSLYLPVLQRGSAELA